ncbi:MAG: GCD complex subunit gcd7 [Chaenotheca gracillima]|nr:MAG: GCD complex subunit gcd7 [Chaenotheca gracillima]
MPVELRKRKAPALPPSSAPPAKKKSIAKPAKAAASKAKAAVGGGKNKKAEKADSDEKEAAPAPTTNGTSAPKKVEVGSVITLEGFGGEIETHEGTKTTLKQLVDASNNGVVLFTYPKASTPGCTTQASLFRDSYTPLTSTGLAIYGLSADSPKSNSTFKTKQNLPYPLLCDPQVTLIGAIGMKKAPKGTTRGVFVIDKEGKVLAKEPGGPAATVEAVQKLVGESAAPAEVIEAEKAASEEKAVTEGKANDVAQAAVAGEVADSAEKLDGGVKTDEPNL